MADLGRFQSLFIRGDVRLARALWAEFLGTLLFQFFVGLTTDAYSRGLAYAVVVYGTQQVSGGHINPANTLGMVLGGHFHWATGGFYILSQVVGAVLGALLQVALVPGVHVGRSGLSPGCFNINPDVSNLQLWGWETILSFLLVFTMYAVSVARPGHGSVGPLAVGLAVLVGSVVGGPYTGAAIIPVQVIAQLIVYWCNWGTWWIYLIAHFVGAALAALAAAAIFGWGSAYTDTDGTREPLVGRGAGTVEDPVV